MVDTIELIPAQIEFLKKNIPSFDKAEWSIEIAGQAGSQRRFLRVQHQFSSQSYILIIWDSKDEDWDRFLTIANDISVKCHILPSIFSVDKEHGLILEEDLGSTTLKRFVDDFAASQDKIITIYKQVIDVLTVWQSLDVSTSRTVSSRALDLEVLLWETSYFARHCVTEFCAKEFSLDKQWEDDRMRLALEVSKLERAYLHRDFQSENVLIVNGVIRFVDFQGARLGPPDYDLASLIYDPYINSLDKEMISTLLNYYIQKCKGASSYRTINLCAAQRLMQALGAYGNLSIHKGKSWYTAFIPIALPRLKDIMSQLPDFPGIKKVVDECCNTL